MRRTDMLKAREILRLKHQTGLSLRDITKSCNCGKTTVSEVLERARKVKIEWPLDLNGKELISLLYPTDTSRKERVSIDALDDIYGEIKDKEIIYCILDWAEKDTRGYIYDPVYFNINEVNRRLYYALENDEYTAIETLAGEGLTGKVHWGWSDACVKTPGKTYSMQQIGDMLLRIGADSIVIFDN